MTVTVFAAPVISFSAVPPVIVRGREATLTWLVTDATLVTIEPDIGAQLPTGTVRVRPQQTTTYILTATGPGGCVRTGQATVTVAAGRRRAVRH